MSDGNPDALLAITTALKTAVPAASRTLEQLEIPPEEGLKERHLKAALRDALIANDDITLSPTEHSVTLAGWPKVGAVDLAVVTPGGEPVLIELKWGAATVYACAWDALKLALALREGIASAAYMVAGAPQSEWDAQVPGSELLRSSPWRSSDVLDTHADNFAYWRRKGDPQLNRVPAEFETQRFTEATLAVHGVPWRLVATNVRLTRSDADIHIDADGHLVG